MAVDETFTTGVLNALNKNRNRTVCTECGFPLPVYPGRYPSKCPGCGAELKLNEPTKGENKEKD